jgi:hypothetical protein
MQESACIYHPLVPLYYKRLRTLTIMDAFMWCNVMKGGVADLLDSKESIFERALEFARSSKPQKLSNYPDDSMNLETWRLKKSKIRAELTFTLTFTLTTLTHHDAALTPVSREQGEDRVGVARLTLVLILFLVSSPHMGCGRYFGFLYSWSAWNPRLHKYGMKPPLFNIFVFFAFIYSLFLFHVFFCDSVVVI